MDSITVPVSALFHAAAELSNERINYVTLSVLDGFEDEDGTVPPYLHFEGYDPKTGEEAFFDDLDIDAVDLP